MLRLGAPGSLPGRFPILIVYKFVILGGFSGKNKVLWKVVSGKEKQHHFMSYCLASAIESRLDTKGSFWLYGEDQMLRNRNRLKEKLE